MTLEMLAEHLKQEGCDANCSVRTLGVRLIDGDLLSARERAHNTARKKIM